MPPELLIFGIPIVVLVPAAVQGAKHLGLSTKYAGVASVVICGVVLALLELQKEPTLARFATWALLTIVYGLAAAGFYSQVKRVVSQ
jgi:uncharacterized membrane protein YhfC